MVERIGIKEDKMDSKLSNEWWKIYLDNRLIKTDLQKGQDDLYCRMDRTEFTWIGR